MEPKDRIALVAALLAGDTRPPECAWLSWAAILLIFLAFSVGACCGCGSHSILEHLYVESKPGGGPGGGGGLHRLAGYVREKRYAN